MNKAVEQSCCEFLTAKDLDPLSKGEICRDDCTASFIAVSQQIEEQLSTISFERHKAQFVYDEKFHVSVSSL